MKPFFLFLSLLPLTIFAQRVITLDPEKDIIARRDSAGSLQFIVPTRAVAVAIQESFPRMSDIQSLNLQKIGKSNYIIVSGRELHKPEENFSLAMLLAETSPGEFQADGLVISCSSAGDCRECSLPPVCTCSKGEGSCGQNSVMIAVFKKITLTLFD